MQVLVPILIVIVIAVAVSIGIVMRRRSARPSAAPSPDRAYSPPAAESPPMTDLESALAQVIDSAGRPIRDRIDAESDNVDHLRVPDDTGPLLRRALDHVANPAADANPAIDSGVDPKGVADTGNGTGDDTGNGGDGTTPEA